MEITDIACRWIDKQEIWKIADEVRDRYWPGGILPVDTEKIVEFEIKLGIEPVHNLFSTIDVDAYLKGDLSAIVADHDFYMNDKYSNRIEDKGDVVQFVQLNISRPRLKCSFFRIEMSTIRPLSLPKVVRIMAT